MAEAGAISFDDGSRVISTTVDTDCEPWSRAAGGDPDVYFDIDRTVKAVVDGGFKRVALQFPDIGETLFHSDRDMDAWVARYATPHPRRRRVPIGLGLALASQPARAAERSGPPSPVPRRRKCPPQRRLRGSARPAMRPPHCLPRPPPAGR